LQLQIPHTIRAPKNINLGVDSVNPTQPDLTLFIVEYFFFCFSKYKSNFELKFLGIVDKTPRRVVYYFQIFSHFQNMFCVS
jgi:hypothetical protein